jgi:hypothetical protein
MKLGELAAALRPLPLWPPVGLEDPQQLVRVVLTTSAYERDVTGSQVILSLTPLMIGISLPGGTMPAPGSLRFQDCRSDFELGALTLSPAGTIEFPGVRLARHLVLASSHRCLSAATKAWQRVLRWRSSRSASPSFRMPPEAIEHLQVLYISPRPVVLVSVDDGVNANMFPMDLVGPIHGGGFTLALRNTSPSVQTLKTAGHAALAHVSYETRALAYGLGRHHALAGIDWSKLPFETRQTGRFGLRVPSHALRLREVAIVGWEVAGSHTVFLCSVLTDETRARAPQLFHTSGIHCAWRQRRGAVAWRETSPA